MMHDPFQHATLGIGVFYRDPWAALEWLERAFGFRRSMLVTDPSGRLVHSEMRFADAISSSITNGLTMLPVLFLLAAGIRSLFT
ncbi:hypothetical protein [Mesorhizobium amorphae]|uniref:hypothetical protein n=1 Tax=Mesorhizobium amorphae TaxID=71433 RepID=UPI0021B1B60C|nr:hypothetical protein [Mesorhizobium amorphae]